MSRPFNFSPGPATLPLSVLEEIQGELVAYGDSGISMLEHSHRGAAYGALHDEAIATLKRLLRCEDTHEVLFMTGGASTVGTLVAMNLLPPGGKGHADYVDTGVWSEKALLRAATYGNVRWAASGREDGVVVRAPMELEAGPEPRYVHITSNATIAGVQYRAFPSTDAPLVVDASSDFLQGPLDMTNIGLLYAGAQKNLGPAGVTVVLIRKDVLELSRRDLPDVFRFSWFAEKRSLGNTPPTFPIYALGKVLRWVESIGLEEMARRNAEKARLLYGALDARRDVYRMRVETPSRSQMNAVFQLQEEANTARFLEEAAATGLVNLKGHRTVGGVRVSMYNAMPLEGVQKLAAFIGDFEI